MNAIQVILIGAICLACLLWQVFLFSCDSERKDSPPIRIQVPLIAGFLIIIGAIVYCVIVRLDPRKASIESATLLSWVGRALVFAIVINVKGYLSPLFFGFITSSEVYYLLEYGEWHPVPVLSALADWVFEFAPDWASAVYLGIQTAYCFMASVADTAVQESPSP